MFTFSIFLTLAVVVACFLAFFLTRIEPELILGSGIVLLMFAGILAVERGLSGFSNPGLITIACLYVIAAGLRKTGALEPFIRRTLDSASSLQRAQLRIISPVAILSTILNNTPIVAALIPGVISWSRRRGISPSRLLLPISYAAILGGTCTLIGTSTNLVVNGMLLQQVPDLALGIFEIAWVGVPVAAIGILYLTLFGQRLLKDRIPAHEQIENVRKYTVEMQVEPGGELVGKTIRQAGLRSLHGLYLAEMQRDDLVLFAMGPDTVLRSGDRLVFVGMVSSIGELLGIQGLRPLSEQVFKLQEGQSPQRLVEAVIAPKNPLIGKTIREGKFRSRYNAVVLAVIRDGERLDVKAGDVVLRHADTLLMLARRSFIEQHRISNEFLFVNTVGDEVRTDNRRARVAWFNVSTFVLLAAFNLVPIVQAALLSAGLMVVTRCLSWSEAKKSLDLQVLLVIAFAFGLGTAIEDSGTAMFLAESVIRNVGSHPFFLLILVYFITLILTETITNNAAAVISYSISFGLVSALDYNIVPYAVAIMIAASASFMTPLGYQTNLMVYGAGGYRFVDYLRLGAPLSLLTAIVALAIIPRVWPLT